MVAVCLSAVMLGLEITSIPSILPVLEKVLPANFKQLQWIMNAYTIAMCSVLVAMGALADQFGRKRMFLIGIFVFGLASLLCGIATSAPLLIAARFLQGLSAAAMLACQVAILSHQFQNGPERGVAFAWWGIIFGLGLGFGPIIGGALVELTSWHWVFLIHVAIAALTILLARSGVQESVDPNAGRIDFLGMATLSIGVFGLVYLITQGQGTDLLSKPNLVIIAISIIMFAVFAVVETRVARPMFDFQAFRVRNFSGALMGASGMNFSFWPFVIYLPIYLQAVLGYDSFAAGLTVLAYTLPTIIVPPLAERLLMKRGPGFVIPLGLSAIGIGFICMRLVIGTDQASWLSLLPGFLLAGIGLGLTNTPVTNTASGSMPPERAGMASGMEFSARMISLALNIAVMGFILVKGVSLNLQVYVTATVSADDLTSLANALAAGNLAAVEPYGVNPEEARAALAGGFVWVLTYGALAPLLLAAISRITFTKHRETSAVQS
nr:MFS transporter [Rhizobium lemnae]